MTTWTATCQTDHSPEGAPAGFVYGTDFESAEAAYLAVAYYERCDFIVTPTEGDTTA